MYSKYAYCNIINYTNFIIFPDYTIQEKNIIINNILYYIDCYLEKNNIGYLKILIFLKDDFEIINISLIIKSYTWGYVFVPFTINENINIIFENNISVFNIKKSINNSYDIKKIMNTETPIIYATQQEDEFIVVEQNDIIHVSYYVSENNESNLVDKCYYLPLSIDNNIVFIKQIKYENYTGIIIIYENGVISFLSNKKILFGMTSLNVLTYIHPLYLTRTRININKNNICSIDYRCLSGCKINMFYYYYLELLINICLKNKINIYIVKNIMICLFNDIYILELLNLLIDEYLKKIFITKSF